jgi:ferredoxin
MTILICNCNQTMPQDASALSRVLDEPVMQHRALCRREAPAFQQATRRPDELVVACTQEAQLFTQLAQQTEGAVPLDVRPIRFVNLRETGGWSRQAERSTPKMAALLAVARLPDPEPVPTVSYHSQGRLLVIGPLEAAEQVADAVGDVLEVSLLSTGGAGRQTRPHAVLTGRITRLSGWLGAFTLVREVSNPIDVDLCTRCNACVAACPEEAIGLDYQIDLSRCKAHRDCVSRCEVAGAIRFDRPATPYTDTFDLVLDLRAQPAFAQHAPPQGYWHVRPGADSAVLLKAILALRDAVGTFEKPKFFNYQANLCAHARNQRVGCDACVQVCSASAITGDVKLQRIQVNPHLCVGCGACTTACPTGALTYAYPRATDMGQRLKTLLQTHARAGGRNAVVLLHSATEGQALIDDWGRAASLDQAVRGVPARVLPLAVWHTASLGVELWLTALAYGAAEVAVLSTTADAPQYRETLRQQMAVAQSLLHGLGYTGQHLRLIEVRDARDLVDVDAAFTPQALPHHIGVSTPASFAAQQSKRATLELALDHLLRHAPQVPSTAIPLPPASPLGAVQVNADRCTLCMSCVSACPAKALQDNPDAPELRLIEKNCVQCGLCVQTCPEQALQLVPRFLPTEQRQRIHSLHRAQPWQCVRCAKPFGTAKGIEAMLARLSGHAMFQGEALERLKMCGDCRVVDIYSNPNETRITKL